MKDLISRKMLIKHLNECLKESDGGTPITDAVITAIKCAVEQMPSVDALPIDREKVKDFEEILKEFTDSGEKLDDLLMFEMVEAYIAEYDMTDVVRCKNCKHLDPENNHCDHAMGTSAPLSRSLDDFCSYGEWKEDENGNDA